MMCTSTSSHVCISARCGCFGGQLALELVLMHMQIMINERLGMRPLQLGTRSKWQSSQLYS